MTIPKSTNKAPSSSSQSKLSCMNCGDNLGDSSRRVYAFQSFINNAPARVFVEAAIQELYRLNDPPDFKCQDECVLCVHCCLLLSQMFGLFRLFEARQNPEGLLASCSSSAFKNGAPEGKDADLMQVYVSENEAAPDEGLVSFYGADDSADDDDNLQGCPSPPSIPDDEDDDQDDKSSKTEAEYEEGSKAEALSLKDANKQLILSKICPDGKQLIFQCADCSQAFKQAVQLRTHRGTAHDSREAYKCAVCNDVFPSETTFRRHLFQHLKVGKNKSVVKSDRTFPKPQPTLAKHKRSMHSSSALKQKLKRTMKPKKTDGSTATCEICDKIFPNIFLLRKHRIVVHAQGRQPKEDSQFEVVLGAEVEIGNESTADPDYNPKADHSNSSCESGSEVEEDKPTRPPWKNLSPGGQVGITCSDCSKPFKTLKYFSHHRRTKHPDSPIYECSICQLILPTGILLVSHVYEEHRGGPQSQPRSQVTFKCSDCNLTYESVMALGRHRREDHGDEDRPYKCHLCPVEFKRPQGLSNHIMFKHSGAPVPECKDCDIKFSNHRCLRVHMQLKHHIAILTRGDCARPEHSDKIMFVCVKCNNEEFPTEEAYSDHIRNVHNKEVFKCPQCPKFYFSEGSFRRHLKFHNESPHACDICEATFPNYWDLKRHLNYEHIEQPTLDEDPPSQPPTTQDHNPVEDIRIEINQDPVSQLFRCPQCSLEFDSKTSCHYHLKQVHTELMNFECEICGNKFRQMKDLRRHRKERHQAVKCEYCDFVSSGPSVQYHCKKSHRLLMERKKLLEMEAQKRLLKEEEEAMKLAGPKFYPCRCADCDEPFTFLRKLMKHRTEAHPDQEKLKCPYCFNVSTKVERLKSHMLAHDEGTDWPCGECPLRFLFKPARNKHLTEVHGMQNTKGNYFPLPPQSIFKHLSGQVSQTEKPSATNTGEKKYKCPECHEGFCLSKNLGNHRVLVHGLKDSERFKCYQCPRVLPTQASYEAHVQRHGEKNILCAECGKCFATRDYLTQHWALMHDEAAGAKFRAKYKRSREKKKGQQQVTASKSTVEGTSDESDVEF